MVLWVAALAATSRAFEGRSKLVARRRFYSHGAVGDVAGTAGDAVVDRNQRCRSKRFVVVGGHAERGFDLFVEAAHTEKLVGIRWKLPVLLGQQEFLIARIPETRELPVHQDGWKNGHQVVVIRSTAKLCATAIFFCSCHTARAVDQEA